MISINKKVFRGAFIVAAAVMFAASALFLNSPQASMQAGSNTIVFDRYDTAVGYTKVFRMNADGTEVTDLGRGFDPVWSPDGTKIAYGFGNSETSDIWTMNADGSNKQQLTQNFGSYAPAWSPDGTRIAFTSFHENGVDHVFIINVDGSNQQKLNQNAAGITREYTPSWTPDSSKVIFLGYKVVNGLSRYDYYSADASNSGATTQLTFLNALFDIAPAGVAPDGSKIAVEYAHAVQTFTLDGNSTLTRLTPIGSLLVANDPDYSPNGSKIVFTWGNLLWIMDADGSNPVNLDVLGRNADWNPTAIVSEPTPTPTVAPMIEADIDVDATVSQTTVAVGTQVTYSIDVKNLGGDGATGATLSSPFPASLTLGNIQASQGSCAVANNQLDCQLGTIPANDHVTITLTATVNTVGFVSMNFVGSAIENDPNGRNNSESVGVTAVGPCATPLSTKYEVTKIQWRRYDALGQDELTFTIRNRAGRSLDPRVIFVFDGLPQGVSIDKNLVAGYTQCSTPQGSPYVVAFAPNGEEWKDMQTVSFRVLFNNPSRAGIPYSYRLYTGVVNP